jgi:hypothetical protein
MASADEAASSRTAQVTAAVRAFMGNLQAR